MPARPPSFDLRNTNSVWCSVLVETFVRLGLRQAVIAPGSRSAPLTFAFARHPQVEAIPVLDERSAGFFALGLAKQGGAPVALVCTSGTAAANFLPAVVEAYETGVPLVVLTADRPPELRDCHSGQSINQQRLFGSFVGLFREMPVPRATRPALRTLVKLLSRAWDATAWPMTGPVHLNCPFRDPLPPLPEKTAHGLRAGDLLGILELPRSRRIRRAFRLEGDDAFFRREAGLIVVGPNEPASPASFAAAVGRVSRALGWPVLADALSPVRMHRSSGPMVVAHYDTVLRSAALADELRAPRVLCVGGWPTSKVLREWLKRCDPETVLVTARTDNMDGLHLRTRFVRGDFETWSAGFRGRQPAAPSVARWLEADCRVAQALAAGLSRERGIVEPAVVPVLAENLPNGTPVFVASSMPARDLEYFWPRSDGRQCIRFNRGANGIDGTLSSALGVAHGGPPAVLLTGDLALLHDTNGFLSVPRFRGSLTIVLINNHGGGIFEHLPVAQFNPPFEEFFATPQSADFAKLCAAYGVEHGVIRSLADLARRVARLPKRGVRVLEVRTDRKRDAALRKRLFAQISGS